MSGLGIIVIGIIALCLLVVLPVLGLLTEHQRKMAELMRTEEGDRRASQNELLQIREELRAIKEALHILALESGRAAEVRERLEEDIARH